MRRTIRVKALSGATVLALAVGLVSATPAGADQGSPPPVTAGSRYLALGDSVSFGYRESANLPTPDYADAASFVGFPENVGAELGLKVANASCPGETSASLIDDAAPSNGCETDAAGTGPGYRTAFPLHVGYPNSQLAYATSYLRRHPDTRLVSLMIGANDGFLCQRNTPDNCVDEFADLLATISKNVAKTLRTIRRNAHYAGQIVIVNYYSIDYTDQDQVVLSRALNFTMDQAAAPYDVVIADGYGAFEAAAEQAGGDTCAAGLLTTLTTGGCGIHPSVAGQEVLAGAVERAIDKG